MKTESYITLNQVLKNKQFKEIIDLIRKIPTVKDIILFGGLRKRRRTSKDVDLLIISTKVKFPSFIEEKINGYIHHYNVFWNNVEYLTLRFRDIKFSLPPVKFLGVDLWETDIEHKELAFKSLGIRKPLSVFDLLK